MSNQTPFPLSKSVSQAVDVYAASVKERDDETEKLAEQLKNSTDASRFGLKVLGVGLIGFLLWAVLVPLGEGVPTQGVVSIDTKRRAVQHLRGGIIREVSVKEGQWVKQGDLLMKLDDEIARANYESSSQQLAAYKENIVAQQAILRGLKSAEDNRREQLKLLQQELDGIRGLVAEGYAPKVQQLQLERTMADIQTAISENKANQQRTEQAILEIRHQMQAAEQAKKANADELGRFELRSPVAGQVVGLSAQSVGAVVQPAQRIMDIVPQDETLVIESRIPPASIDRIAQNDPVDIRFSSFSQSPQLVVPGRVISISQDVLTDQQTGVQYYLARSEVTAEGVKQLGSREMRPGMPAEVIVQTGSRTLLQYLLHPLTRRVAASLKEE